MLKKIINSTLQKPHTERKKIAIITSVFFAGIALCISIFSLVHDIERMKGATKNLPVERPSFFSQVKEIFTAPPTVPPTVPTVAPATSTDMQEALTPDVTNQATTMATTTATASSTPAENLKGSVLQNSASSTVQPRTSSSTPASRAGIRATTTSKQIPR